MKPLEPEHNFDVAILGLLGQLGVSEKDAKQQLKRMRDKPAAERRLRKRVRGEQNRIEREHNERILDNFAAAGESRHRARRIECQDKLATRRAAMSLGQRLDEALAKARTSAGVAASNPEAEGGTHADSSPPPAIAGTCYSASEESTFDTFNRRANKLIEQLEREVDNA